ncbi:MAG: response regulator transcription factor [Chloroflexota bacterium]
MGRPIRVLIIAPQDLSRNGLVALLGRPGSNIRVVGAFRDLEDGEAGLSQLDPQVLLLDDALPPATDIAEVLQRLRLKFAHLSILVLSGRLHVRYLQMLFGAGASGYLYREDRLEESLISGIETVCQGYGYASPRASGLGIGNRPSQAAMQLNSSDLEVLHLIDQGFAPKEIAAALKVTPRTVYRIRNKLRAVVGAPTHEHLLMAARAKGLLSDTGRAPTDPA